MNRGFYISTLGCRLNQAESQELEELLTGQGWHKADKPEKADLIVVNSCVVTTKAERETRKEIRRLKRENPEAKIVSAGCWVNKINQFGGIEVEDIDEFIKNKQKWEWAEGLMLNAQGSQGVTSERRDSRALIKIQTGCHNQCAYCLPTLVRGPSVSVSVDKVVNKVQQAVTNNVVEVVLTGQNVSQYNDNGRTWIDLVKLVLDKTDVQLIRLGSINPTLVEKSESLDGVTESFLQGVTEKLIGIFQGVGKGRLARHLHLSLQSGSDQVLKRMNRNYTTEQFANLVNILRRQVEGINITTDIIVGFPGETKKDFQKTLDFCREIKFGKIHVFRYSPRKGTEAYKKRKEWGRVHSKVKNQRSKKIRQLEKKLRRQFWKSQLDKTAVAKIWEQGEGLTDNYIPIKVDLDPKLPSPVVKEVELLTFVDDPLRRIEASRRKITAKL